MRRVACLLVFGVSLAWGCADGPDGPALDAGGHDGGIPYPEYVPPVIAEECPERTGPGMDMDGDGFRYGVDCDDCHPLVNPGAFDVPGNGEDEDCDGEDASPTPPCDAELPMSLASAADAELAAAALGLCQPARGRDWGLISARLVRVDGEVGPASLEQVGLLDEFGVQRPLEGARMLALSSGVARAPAQAGFTSACDFFEVFAAAGHPAPDAESLPEGLSIPRTADCGMVDTGGVFNSVALELELQVPTNARGFSFRSNFFTYEYPNYICSVFNDYFVVLREREDLGIWENVVFDAEGGFISVNNGLLQACEAGRAGGKDFACELGRGPLAGTGFDESNECGAQASFAGDGGPGLELEVGAATGWLRTRAPVLPGSILRLRFAVWDSGDGLLDSLALIDGFEWELVPVDAVSTEPELI